MDLRCQLQFDADDERDAIVNYSLVENKIIKIGIWFFNHLCLEGYNLSICFNAICDVLASTNDHSWFLERSRKPEGLARVEGKSLDQEHVTGVCKNVVEPLFQL